MIILWLPQNVLYLPKDPHVFTDSRMTHKMHTKSLFYSLISSQTKQLFLLSSFHGVFLWIGMFNYLTPTLCLENKHFIVTFHIS